MYVHIDLSSTAVHSPLSVGNRAIVYIIFIKFNAETMMRHMAR